MQSVGDSLGIFNVSKTRNIDKIIFIVKRKTHVCKRCIFLSNSLIIDWQSQVLLLDTSKKGRMKGSRRYTATSRPSDTSVSAAPSDDPIPPVRFS